MALFFGPIKKATKGREPTTDSFIVVAPLKFFLILLQVFGRYVWQAHLYFVGEMMSLVYIWIYISFCSGQSFSFVVTMNTVEVVVRVLFQKVSPRSFFKANDHLLVFLR